MLKLSGAVVEISVRDNVREAGRYLDRVRKQAVTRAAAKAITFTAERGQKDTEALIPQVFSNPTPFTRRAIRKTTARPSQLEAMVYIKDLSLTRDHYLVVHTTGGGRQQKPSERRLGWYWVTSKYAETNRYGNLTRGTMSKILADVGALNQYAGDAQNTKGKRQGGRGKTYFMQRMPDGRRIVFKRVGRTAVPWLVEVLKRPSYRVRLPLERTVVASVNRNFVPLFNQQLARELEKV